MAEALCFQIVRPSVSLSGCQSICPLTHILCRGISLLEVGFHVSHET